MRSGAEINFSDLSSGEKILASFALCLYYAAEKNQIARYPRVLLLDEIDAPLHPSMTQSVLAAIQRVLIAQEKVKVVLTTHSPTTVALTPESSLYKMHKDHPGVVEKATKD